MRVLWLTPNKPENISVGRRRIADHLLVTGVEVTMRGTTWLTALRSLGERDRYDVVVGTTRAGALAATAVSLAGGPPLVIDHVDPIRQFAATHDAAVAAAVRLAENATFRLADHVCYVYEEERERVERRAAQVTKSALPVDYERFADPSPAAVDRARSRLDEKGVDGPVLVYVGGLEPIYNVELLLDAADQLPAWTLVVLGAGSLGPAVRRAADRRENVIFLGTVPPGDVPGYLHAADVGVCLVDDPHTLKLLEYGAARLPAVQLAGRANERFEGLVEFCEGSPRSVAHAVSDAAARDEERLDRFQAFARQFDDSEIAAEYKTVLDAVTGGEGK